MPTPNRRREPCAKCNRPVEPGDGTSAKVKGEWRTWCFLCRAFVSSDAETVRMDVACVRGTLITVIRAQGFLPAPVYSRFNSAVRSAGGAREPVEKYHYCALADTEVVANELKSSGFGVMASVELRDAILAETERSRAYEAAAIERADAIDARLSARGKALFPYQRDGARLLASALDGYCLFDDMGLGKTVQALAAIAEAGRAVVVAPKIAKSVWLRELATWRNTDLRPTILEGRQSFRWPMGGEVVITGYPILPEALPVAPRDVFVIADEAQAVRNRGSSMTVRMQALADSARASGGRCFMLSATPLDNDPMELWTILSIAGCAHRAFGTFDEFAALFEGRQNEHGAWTWGHKGTGGKVRFTFAREIGERLRRVSLRRTKEQVFPEMPPKMYRDVYVTLDRELARACDAVDIDRVCDAIDQLESSDGQARIVFEEVAPLYKRLSLAKLPAMFEEVEAFESADEPLIVFSPHRAPVEALAQRPGWRVITGSTPVEERGDIERRFQAGELRGVAGTIKAMGTAVTLTRSCNELFVSRSFVPGQNDQAEDRANRLTQTRAVTITRLMADHVLERRISEILDRKAALINASTRASTRSAGDKLVTRADALAAMFGTK